MNKKSTKRALLCSLLSLVVCISMLVGTTFAWFTDSVSSLNNIIKSGNLDVELEYSTDMSNWTPVTSETKLFDENALWEPGYTQVVYLKVSNKGSLALKYNLGVNVYEERAGVNQEGNTFKLSDYIYYGVDEQVADKYADRAAAIDAVKDGSEKLSVAYTKAGSLLAKAEGAQDYPSDVVAMVVYMPETVGNVANHNGNNIPVIKLGVNLYATQFASESDSFGIDYDVLADFVPAWDGTIGEVPAETNGEITISTAAELAAFAKSVNEGTSYSGKTILLANSINLGDEEWTPIGACNSATYFQGTFDGQGNTVFNVTVDKSEDPDKNSTAGFFGWIDAAGATIKNLKLANANVKGSHWVGAVVGYMTGTVENCEVFDSTVIGYHVNNDADGDKVGGLVGFLNKGELINNTVEATTISGNRDIGGLVGAVSASNCTLTGNTVANTSITYITEKDYASAAEIVSGRTGFVADDTNVAVNVTVYKGELVAEGVVKTANNSYDVISKEGLLNANGIIASASTGEGRNLKVRLLSDIDLAGETWKPIEKMWVDFDGNGKTISNLTANAWKAGLFGYLGGGSIKNLTLENVNITGAQAGAFAGAVEGTIDNCVLKGKNVITYVEKHQYDNPSEVIEAWGGIGAITGIIQPCTVNATIAEGTTVTLDYGAIVTEAAYVDQLTGYIGTNKGTVTNNGTITAIRKAATAAAVQEMLNKAEDGTVIMLTDDISGVLVAPQKPGVKVVIDGGEKEFNGCLVVDGKSATNTSAGITIKNVNFVADEITEDACINLGDGTNDTRYTCNVTVENCTFDVTGAVGVKSYTGGDKNLTIKNCTATANAHSLVQAKGIDGILVEDCKVYSKNGLNFNNSDNVTVRICTVDVTGYAVRFGESSGGSGAAETYLIKDSTLKSACDDGDAVIVLRGTADYSTLTLDNTTLEGTIKITNTATGATVVKK